MLRELAVENIAIIDRARLELGSGFTALTGETGAGKSLVIDSIDLALGGRSSSEQVRAGADKGVVILKADAQGPVLDACQRLGIEPDQDGCLVILREVSAKGGSSVRINGRPASVGVLKEVGALLVDLHGQHDHQSLLDEEKQIEFLDSWIGAESASLRQLCAEAFARAEQLRRRLAALRSSRREREQRIDMLRFQVDEISQAAPRPGEMELLEALLARLQNAEKLRSAALTASSLLGQGEAPLVEGVAAALAQVESGARLDPGLAPDRDALTQALELLLESSRSLARYAEALEMDPAALEETAARIDLLKRLRRKYGDTEEQVLEFCRQAEQELLDLTGDMSSEEEAIAALDQAEKALDEACMALSHVRRAKAKDFAAETLGHVQELAMEKARFALRMDQGQAGPAGWDLVSFLFSANPGEPLLPLAKVASGGELSRVMLAIKAAGAGRAGVPTLIFDEVDTGLSGRAAAVMARKLQAIAAHKQVVVISHLPQIAGASSSHWRIEKVEADGRSVTRLTPLEGEERVLEIARMLAGETVGETALANARELLG